MFNAGLMVLEPSKQTFSKLIDKSKNFHNPSKAGGNQYFMNYFFANKWNKLGLWLHNIGWELYRKINEKKIRKYVHSIHYTTEKPCKMKRHEIEKSKTLKKWLTLYDEMIKKYFRI